MQDKTEYINRDASNLKKKKFVLKNLSKKQRDVLLTGGAAIGGAGMASLLASSFSFVSKEDIIHDVDPDVILNLDIDNDGISNDVDDDIDGDGILNKSDTDMDGDGIENSRDEDNDGDGILNVNDDHTPEYENDEPPVVIYTEAPFSELELDDMSFSDAFADARHDVGAGGFFEWHGEVYNTYYKEEWDSLSHEEQNEFMHSVVENTNFDDVHELDDPSDIVDIIHELDDNDDLVDTDDDNDDHDNIIEEDLISDNDIHDDMHDDLHDDITEDYHDDFDDSSDMDNSFIDDIMDA